MPRRTHIGLLWKHLVAALLAFMPAPLAAERVRPTSYGAWDVRCMSGITGSGRPSCNIDRIIRRPDVHGYETLLYVRISSGFDEQLTVQVTGPNRATCETLDLRETVRRGYNPYNDRPTDVVVAALHGRLVTTLRSHIPMFGVCTAMKRHESDFSADVLDASATDLRAAIDHIERHWTWHRRQVNPVARDREPAD